MRNVHRELIKTPDAYVFSVGCPPVMYKNLTAFTLSRLEQILNGSEDFISEESWLIRNDLTSLVDTLKSVTGAYPSQQSVQGGKDNVTDIIEEKYPDIQCV